MTGVVHTISIDMLMYIINHAPYVIPFYIDVVSDLILFVCSNFTI